MAVSAAALNARMSGKARRAKILGYKITNYFTTIILRYVANGLS